MVFEWRNYRQLTIKLKKYLIVLLAILALNMPLCAFSSEQTFNDNIIATETTTNKTATDVLKGSVSVDIIPYCENWSSEYANKQINRIGSKLIQANNIEKDITFVVSDDKDANASANLKNVITVNLGLLKYVETEDELAYVIGHEMGHISKNHVKKSLARNIAIKTAGIAGSVLTVAGIFSDSVKMAKSGAIVTGSAIVGGVANKSLSRGQETKSDSTSIDYMVKAGYNPLASISILNKISGNYFDIFSDHPSGGKRIKKAYKYIAKNYPEYLEKGYNSTSYQRALQYINK